MNKVYNILDYCLLSRVGSVGWSVLCSYVVFLVLHMGCRSSSDIVGLFDPLILIYIFPMVCHYRIKCIGRCFQEIIH